MIDGSDISVCVHTHPGRVGNLGPVLDSLEKSDVGFRFSIECQPEGASNYEKILWWLLFLSKHARLGKYVLRLEDDVIVNRHIVQNLCSWTALKDPDFGVGLGFAHRSIVGQFVPNQFGLVRSEPGQGTAYAQMQLFESQALISATKVVWEVLASEGYTRGYIDRVWSRFDGTITKAIARICKRTYLHRPSLVDCSDVSRIDSISSRRPHSGAGASEVLDTPQSDLIAIPHRAVDFLPDWRNE